MTPNLTLSHTLASTPLQVQYLSACDIPLALGLIASIKSSGALHQPHHLKPRAEAELLQLYNEGYPLLGIKDCEGELIAFATISKISADDDSLIIRSLCTSSDYKGYGCGQKIIEEAIVWSTDNGASCLKAKVSADNAGSLSLFKKAGFSLGDLQWDNVDHYAFYLTSLNSASALVSMNLNNEYALPTLG